MNSATQPLGILDLPNELLRGIFKELKDSCWSPDEKKMRIYATRDISNVRLACQRFYTTSSHLLLDSVTVEMNFDSLKRFLEISHHLLIAPGVRVVRVLLHYYNCVLAGDLGAYGRYNAAKISPVLHYLEHNIVTSEDERLVDISQEHLREACRQGQHMVESWSHLEQDGEEGPFERMALSGHNTYRSLYEQQEFLREQECFSRYVAYGMAIMPAARKLEFCDSRNFYLEVPAICDVMKHEKMMKMLTSPSSWNEDRDWFMPPPSEIVIDLPRALHTAGVQLTGLRIAVPLLRSPSTMTSLGDYSDLPAIMQNLRRFEYAPEFGTAGEELSTDKLLQQCKYLPISLYTRAILDSPNLEVIHLDYFPKPPECVFESMIPHRYRQKLKGMHLAGCYIHAGCLRRFLKSCDPAVFQHINLWHVTLLSDTWAETLDMLRDCSCYVSLDKVMGAECEGLDWDKVKWLFRPGEDKLNRASRYVLRLTDTNPMLEVA